MDLWTSIRMQSYLSVTAHFIINDQLEHFLLATDVFRRNHTTDNIKTYLLEVLESFGIATSSVVAVVTDNAANMVSACRDLEAEYAWRHIRCSAHTLQLCLKEGEAIQDIKKALDACRSIVSHFRRSEKAMSALRRRYQLTRQPGDPDLEMIIDVTTRWNSVHNMVANMIKHQWVVRATLSTGSTSRTFVKDLTESQWQLLEGLVGVLKPFKDVSDFLEGQAYPSLASLYPLVKGLNSQLREMGILNHPSCEEFKKTVKQALEQRFPTVTAESTSVNPCHKATWLHPGYKDRYFTRAFRTLVKAAIESECEEVIQSQRSPDRARQEEQECTTVGPTGDRGTTVCGTSKSSTLETLFQLGLETHSNSSDSEYGNGIAEEIG